MSSSPGDVTQLLQAMRRGDQQAAEQLIPLVYSELHRLARSYMRGERGDHTLQPTALINEVYIRMVKCPVDWQNRSHFIAIAARAMRRILVDHARTHMAAKRGAGRQVTVDLERLLGSNPDDDFFAVRDSLDRLAVVDLRGRSS